MDGFLLGCGSGSEVRRSLKPPARSNAARYGTETVKQSLEQMRSNLTQFVDGDRLDGELVLMDMPLLFLPMPLLDRGIYKAFYVGYIAAFQTILDVLSQEGSASLPTVERLRVGLADGALHGRYNLGAVQYFAECGGSVRYALDFIIHQALWESPTPLGDGSFDKKWDEPLSPPLVNVMVSQPLRVTCL